MLTKFAITLTDGTVWLSIGQGLLFGGVCLLVGIWVARFVGLLGSDAPAGETLGVGLASGLLVLAAWWAAIASGGRSSFTPVASASPRDRVAVVRRRRSAADSTPPTEPSTSPPKHRERRRAGGTSLVAVLGGAVFIVAVALLYGSTLALSPRDGVQPLEFRDEAYYSVLGADLAKTGTETITRHRASPSRGLPAPDLVSLGRAVARGGRHHGLRHGAARRPLLRRLAVLLLAAAALTGTLVRRMTGSASRARSCSGPSLSVPRAVPLIPGPFFSSWAAA